MSAKKNLPSLEQCAEPVAELPAIPAARFMEAIWVMCVLAGLGVAHTHLCFQMTDMRLQHKHLQSERKVLENQESQVERQMVSLREDTTLEVLGEARGMRRLDLTQHNEAIVISEALREKYLGPSPQVNTSALALSATRKLDGQPETSSLQRVVFALLDSGSATAKGQF